MSDQGITGADLDGDGVNETIMIDSDGDGLAETVVSPNSSGGLDVTSDTDGDGVYDRVSRDTDGDGVSDTMESDTDGDGVIDTVEYDADGDGLIDVAQYDTNADGVLDTTASDLDGDGVIDVLEFDADDDGQTDVISVAGQTLTLDESGHVVAMTTDPPTGPDSTTNPTQTDPTQTDPTQTDPTQTDPTQVDPTQTDPTQTSPDSTTDPTQTDPTQTDPTQVDPTQVDPTQVDPTQVDPTQVDPTQVDPTQTDATADSDAVERADDAQYWFEQSENGFCAPVSVAMIVGEYSDQPMDEATFVQRAVDLGYLSYDESGQSSGWSGMTIEHTAELLESFGVPATVQYGDVDSLNGLLDQGYNAIVAIDSSEIWTGQATGNVDHAVVVSSIENGMVYLEDPGTPDGQLEAVPVDVFEQAWSASGDQMVVTDNPDTTAPTPGVGPDVFVDPTADTADGTGDGTVSSDLGALIGSSPGAVLLPIVLSGDAVRSWHELHG